MKFLIIFFSAIVLIVAEDYDYKEDLTFEEAWNYCNDLQKAMFCDLNVEDQKKLGDILKELQLPSSWVDANNVTTSGKNVWRWHGPDGNEIDDSFFFKENAINGGLLQPADCDVRRPVVCSNKSPC